MHYIKVMGSNEAAHPTEQGADCSKHREAKSMFIIRFDFTWKKKRVTVTIAVTLF